MEPNGNRINMGAYGGTAEASMGPVGWRSVCDLTNDFGVDYFDLLAFVDYWPEEGVELPADLDRSGAVDFRDLAIFAGSWEL